MIQQRPVLLSGAREPFAFQQTQLELLTVGNILHDEKKSEETTGHQDMLE